MTNATDAAPLFDMPEPLATHPAKYSDELITTMAAMLRGCTTILDPFAGTGKVFMLQQWLPNAKITGIEIEPEWAALHPGVEIGNALDLPFPGATFDAVCTSPTYGNRMADHDKSQLRDGPSRRNTYASHLQRKLHPDNSGSLQWGDKYREFHVRAWKEVERVLMPQCVLILNIKDHIRGGVVQRVTGWHTHTLQEMGFTVIRHKRIPVRGLGYGENNKARVEYESVILFFAP